MCIAVTLMLSPAFANDYSINHEINEKQDSVVVLESEQKSGDTTFKHKVTQVDEHLVIQDSIIIEGTKIVVKKEIKTDSEKKWVALSVFIFSIVALIYRKIKREKNEKK